MEELLKQVKEKYKEKLLLIKKLIKERDHLINIIVAMTHHDGAVEETKEHWMPIVNDYFKKIEKEYEGML
jgi:hypothetical protein